MRTIIKSLNITSFKGLKNKKINFSNHITTISGDNGAGKTSIMLAFFWLLNRKDDQDRKDFNIYAIDSNGDIIHKNNVEVEATLLVDEQEVKIKRIFAEKWGQIKGESKEVYQGNTCTSYWDEVPVSEADFQSKINEIIPEKLFKILTNPLFFCSLKWQEQREFLFKLVGDVTDEEIAGNNEDYIKLLKEIAENKDIDMYKRWLTSRKNKIKKEKEDILPKIEQTNKLMPQRKDYEALRNEIADIEKEIANIDETMANKTSLVDEIYKKKQEIKDLKNKQQEEVRKANEEEKQRVYACNDKRREIEHKQKELKDDNFNICRDLTKLKAEKADIEEKVRKNTIDYNNLCNSWDKMNSLLNSQEFICPVCGNRLQGNKFLEKKNQFETELQNITNQGKNIKSLLDELQKEKEEIINKIAEKEIEKNHKLIDLEEISNELNATPIISPKEIIMENVPECKVIQERINDIENSIIVSKEDDVLRDLQNKKIALNEEKSKKIKELADEDLTKKYLKEIEDLENSRKILSQNFADLERKEFIYSSFIEKKIDTMQEKINSLFTHVNFKLKDKTIDGNLIETCSALIDGVPFFSANSAGKINAGIDIINAIGKKYGISAPIFIDNKESVNNIMESNSQMIWLQVTTDNELIIE